MMWGVVEVMLTRREVPSTHEDNTLARCAGLREGVVCWSLDVLADKRWCLGEHLDSGMLPGFRLHVNANANAALHLP